MVIILTSLDIYIFLGGGGRGFFLVKSWTLILSLSFIWIAYINVAQQLWKIAEDAHLSYNNLCVQAHANKFIKQVASVNYVMPIELKDGIKLSYFD